MIFRSRPFCNNVILMRFCVQLLLAMVSRIRRHRQHNRILSCVALPNIAVGFSTALEKQFARHCCWHRNFHSKIPRTTFIVNLNFSSFGSMKNVSLNCLAFSSLGFPTTHLCFAFFFAASDITSTYLAMHHQDDKLFVFSLVSSQTRCIVLEAFLLNERLLWILSMSLTILFLPPSTFQ